MFASNGMQFSAKRSKGYFLISQLILVFFRSTCFWKICKFERKWCSFCYEFGRDRKYSFKNLLWNFMWQATYWDIRNVYLVTYIFWGSQLLYLDNIKWLVRGFFWLKFSKLIIDVKFSAWSAKVYGFLMGLTIGPYSLTPSVQSDIVDIELMPTAMSLRSVKVKYSYSFQNNDFSFCLKI